jgi:hypothetical protein
MSRPRLQPVKARIAFLRGRLGAGLFPYAPAAGSGRGRGETALLLVAFLVGAVVLQLLRIGPSAGLDSLWAEDGQIYLQGALDGSFLHAVTSTYAGYLVVVPRLIGEAGAVVPLRDAPAAITLTAGVVVALSGLAVWVGSANLVRNPYLRGMLVAATVLAPTAALESVASGAYVVWFMLVGTFWLLLWRPRTSSGTGLGAAFILLTGLSTPGVWFFAPLALLRLLATRDVRDLTIVGAFFAGAAVQLPVIALNNEPQIDPVWSGDIWTAYIQRVVDAGALGDRVGGVAWAWLGWPFLIAVVGLAAFGLFAGLRKARPEIRWFAAIAVPTSLVMFVFSAYQRAVGSDLAWPADTSFSYGGRYTIVPVLLLVSTALVLIDRSTGSRAKNLVAAAALALGLLTCFYVGNPAGRGEPSWGEELQAQGATCGRDGSTAARIAISPSGFGVTVPCARLPAEAH